MNKQALVAMLIERHADQLVDIITRTLPNRATLLEGVEAMIEAAMAAHRLDPAPQDPARAGAALVEASQGAALYLIAPPGAADARLGKVARHRGPQP
jgi:Flp pilus assembly protein protease CpaA